MFYGCGEVLRTAILSIIVYTLILTMHIFRKKDTPGRVALNISLYGIIPPAQHLVLLPEI